MPPQPTSPRAAIRSGSSPRAAALQAVVDTGSITLKDAQGSREVPIALATADIALAMKDAA
jgi:hypothetical protein